MDDGAALAAGRLTAAGADVVAEADAAAAERRRQQRLLTQIIDGNSIPTFVIDRRHRVTHWNRALEVLTGVGAVEVIGTDLHWKALYARCRPCMADLVVDGVVADQLQEHYGDGGRKSALIDGAYEAIGFFPRLGRSGVWLFFAAAPLYDEQGAIAGAIETLQDITAQTRTEQELKQYRDQLEVLVEERTQDLVKVNTRLKATNRELEEAHHQLVQSEKMASIGQLAAGVAHEINNPIGFVSSNVGTLETYVRGLLEVVAAYEGCDPLLGSRLDAIREVKRHVELDYIRQDVVALLDESRDGLLRVKKIVQDLKEFSHAGSGEWQVSDLHAGLDSTLNIVRNEIKYRAKVDRRYGELPKIECLPLELNQVFMNILVNAAHAIEDQGEITVSTGTQGDLAWVQISDNGCGIPEESLKRIFDPFFTTKPVGKGTGLGLSISYGIVKKHGGRIEVDSAVGRGTTFRVWLPIRQPQAAAQAGAATTAAADLFG